MAKRTRLIRSALLACVVIMALLETARRNWAVHSWFSVAAHGHVSYRVVHTSELSGRIPEHYPVHSLESQRLVYSGDKYLGYLSKYAFFVPDGQSWESAATQEGRLTAVSFLLELLLGVTAVIAGVLLLRRIGQQDGPANGSRSFRTETNPTSPAAGSRR